MIELKGKYAGAKIFTDMVDEAAISQVIALLNEEFAADSTVRMMPDIHAGIGCTVGTTMTVRDRVCPNLVGVDIGCGMETAVLKEKHIEPQKLDRVIRERVPAGFARKASPHRYLDHTNLEALRCAKYVNLPEAEVSLGTLGGGNHFIEVDADEAGHLYLIVHSGSRILGLRVANYYQKLAVEQTGACGTARDLACVSGALFDDYMHDMKIVQAFADWNRKAIVSEIVKGMGFHVTDSFTTIHNYIDTDAMILRKGAVSAKEGERLLIPINMRDGSLICTGRGNADWNFSAPHGAGRLMSRSAAKSSFTVSEYKKQMAGIYTTSVNQGTLDECPMAYKRMEDIVDNIRESVTIQRVIKPIYNFKAGGEE